VSIRTSEQVIAFVERNGIVLESARGAVCNLAEAIAGAPIVGNWWGHPGSHLIFKLTRAVRDCPDILVCRLVDGKVTYVHRRLWPALVRHARDFDSKALARVCEVHTAKGTHRVEVTPYPAWVPPDVLRAARRLTVAQARDQLIVVNRSFK